MYIPVVAESYVLYVLFQVLINKKSAKIFVLTLFYVLLRIMKSLDIKKVSPFVGLLTNFRSDLGLIVSFCYSTHDAVVELQAGWSWYLLFASIISLLFLYLLRQSVYRRLARRIVVQFYQSVQLANGRSSAWDLLSLDIKNRRWGGADGFSLFKNGFKYTKGMDVKSISMFQKKKDRYDFIMFYVDTIEAPCIVGLEEAQKRTIGEVSELEKYIKNLEHTFKMQGLNEKIFMSIPLQDFFRKNFSDIVRWKYEVDLLDNVEKNIPSVSFLSVKIVSVVRRKKYGIFPIFEINDINNASDYFEVDKE